MIIMSTFEGHVQKSLDAKMKLWRNYTKEDILNNLCTDFLNNYLFIEVILN